MSKKNREIKNNLLKALPQLQCKKCTYKDCESYADSIINQNESLDKCEPGSMHTQNQLFKIINNSKTEIAINKIKSFSIAEIKTNECIGCTICIKVCPVDAIIGAKHKLHFIINDRCNGCELCISECPVDCMKMITNHSRKSWDWPSKQADQSNSFYQNKKIRIDNLKKEKYLAKERLNSSAKIKLYIKNALSREEEKYSQVKEYE
tara:strand:+ start:844 stop:1461 length:618 start_codon:yes stop_codon:yes gene_type:complete